MTALAVRCVVIRIYPLCIYLYVSLHSTSIHLGRTGIYKAIKQASKHMAIGSTLESIDGGGERIEINRGSTELAMRYLLS